MRTLRMNLWHLITTFFFQCFLTQFCHLKLLTDEMLVEKEKYKEIGDGLDVAFEELYGI